nr:TetR-like C-terminal domain-containing protein [Mammaliicoccus sp. Marseille-Q6498]
MNLKSKKSKNKLSNALLTCMNTTPISDITIKALCEVAEVNRSTFYRHHQSIEQLTSSLIEDYFHLLFGEPYKFYIKHQSISESQYYISNNIFSHIHHNTYFYETMFHYYPQFHLKLKQYIKNRYIAFFEDTRLENDMMLSKDVVAEYIASAYVGMIQGWIDNHFSETPEEMAYRMIVLNSNGPIRLLTDAEKHKNNIF